MLNHFKIYTLSHTDVGFFLVVWTLYTAIMWVGAMRIHGAMATTFTLLLLGFIGLDLAHFGFPGLTKPTAGHPDFLCPDGLVHDGRRHLCPGGSGKEILPLGKPWIAADPEPVGSLAKESA